MVTNIMPAASGAIGVEAVGKSGRVYRFDAKALEAIKRDAELDKEYIQKRILAWLRDNVHRNIPSMYYKAMLGHDIHLTMYAQLRARVWRANEGVWVHPYREGLWLPNNDYAPVIARKKVTTTFRDDTADALTDAAGSGQHATFNDYKFHEVGTASTAEANTDTALATSTGIARVTGTQVNPSAAVYRSVGTVTGDTSETWQEHGLFNASSSGQLMDRSVYTGIAVAASDQVQFTYELTLSAEA